MTPYVEYLASAGQTDFTVPFPFISRDHVIVKVNGVQTQPLAWPQPSILKLPFGVNAGGLVVIERNTPMDDQLAKFVDGAVLTARDMNIAVQQVLYKQQELQAAYDRALNRALVRIATNGGVLTVEGEEVLDVIAQAAAADQLLDDFRARIADIDANGTQVLNHAQDLQEKGVLLGVLQTDTSGLRADLDQTAENLGVTTAGLRNDLDTLTDVVDALAGGDPGSGIATLILDEENARIEGDQALIDTIDLIGAKSGDGLAFIANLQTLKVSPTESFASKFEALVTKDGENEAAIVAEAAARTTAISAEAARIDALLVRVGDAEAGIISEQVARADADSAAASAREALAATLRGEAAALIETERTARVNGDSAEASAREGLAATLRAETNAQIQTEQNARVTADSAIADELHLLGAKNAGGTAFILDMNKVKVSAGTSLGTRLSGIDAAISGNNATIVQEQTARANADSALANDISAVSTTVNGHTATISQQATSIDGLKARWGIALDVNGYISGVTQNNSGTTSSFDILADKFRVYIPGLGAKKVFSINGTNIEMTADVKINGNLLVTGSINSGQIGQSAVSLSAYFRTADTANVSAYSFDTWTDLSATGTVETGGSEVFVPGGGGYSKDPNDGAYS